jgi:hypothetical protein
MRRDSEDPNDHRARFESDDDEPSRHQFGEYSRSGVQVDQDRKRRKRVFSNRTKTGCMTCRKRKKKCDELHPECECSPSRVACRAQVANLSNAGVVFQTLPHLIAAPCNVIHNRTLHYAVNYTTPFISKFLYMFDELT